MEETEVISYIRELRNQVRNHERWRVKRTLNLIPSENFASEETRSFLSLDLSNRYSARDHFYRGTRYLDEIERFSIDIAKKLFRCKFASVRPLSGHTCSLIVFLSLLSPGDKLVTCPPEHGGYPGSSELGLGPLLHLKNLYFPYDPKTMNLIPCASKRMLSLKRPEMVVYGSSFIPFPHKIVESLPANFTGYNIYDGSHVMGLIAGRKFQDPLKQGCSILMGSTHKTLFGPQGGLILSNDEGVFGTVDTKTFPGIVDNIHWNRVASLTFSMIELLKFGEKYASQIIRNSKVLAKTLDEFGVRVKCKEIGFTESHQVLLDYGEREAVQIADKLEQMDIITDVGIRIGTSELTRKGMKEGEMSVIGNILADAIVGKASKHVIKTKVHKIVKEFSSPDYTL